MTTVTQPKNAAEMLAMRDSIINTNETLVDELGNKVKLVEAGADITELVQEAMLEVKPVDTASTSSKMKTFIRSLVPWGAVEKIEDHVIKAKTASSTVTETSDKLLNTLRSRIDHVNGLVGDIYELYEQMKENFDNLVTFREAMQEAVNEEGISNREYISRGSVLAGTEKYIETLTTQMKQAQNIVVTGRVTADNLAAEEPKLRASIKSGMVLAAAIEEINKTSGTAKVLGELSDAIADQTNETVHTLQKEAIERQLVTEAEILKIEDSTKRRQQMSLEIAQLNKQWSESTAEKVSRLSKVVDQSIAEAQDETMKKLETDIGTIRF